MTNPAIDAREIAGFAGVQATTRQHRRRHGCNAYTFEDGTGLLAIARADSATRILELGTALGYTACVLATATAQTHVDTIEGDPSHVALARGHIRDLRLDDRVTVHSGDFFDVMAKLAGPYDLVFFDGLGPTLRTVEKLRSLLRPGGLLVCGNLAHASGDERLPIAVELARAERWRLAGSIEGGGTLAFRKIDLVSSTLITKGH
jgi:predicted O-methyltransferase YrrM